MNLPFPRAALAAALALSIVPAAHAVPLRSSLTPADAIARLNEATGNALLQRAEPGSAYTLLRAESALPLSADDALAPPLSRAQLFLSLYGAALGVSDPLAQLQLQRTSRDGAGNTHVHLDQVLNGVPVFGARLVVHMNAGGIYGVNGAFIRGLEATSLETKFDEQELQAIALSAIRKDNRDATLSVSSGQWMIYTPGLLIGRASHRSRLTYVAVVSGAPGEAIKEQVLVDAATGVVLNHISQVHTQRNRRIFTPTQDAPPVLTEGQTLPVPAPADIPLINDPGHGSTNMSTRTSNQPTANLYLFAGGTWELYRNLFNRDGYDACDLSGPCVASNLQVQKSVYLVNDACPNAYWDGDATNYCPGFDADDVVSHEWSHAYTQFTHGLVYQYQSGALNESYSDIFGEAYDLVNTIEGPLGASLTEHEYYVDGGSRWVVGEDLSEAAAALLLRDMWDPDGFPTPSPGSVKSENYACGTGDNGGVHTNSGVPNHTFAMLVDGKTFNDITIPGIGLLKAANIYFQAETHYQTPTSNFAAHADALLASCEDLIGAPLRKLTDGTVAAETITQAECDAVFKAVRSTGMYQAPSCVYVPILKPESATPPACGDSEGAPVFTENWESVSIPAGWTVAHTKVGQGFDNLDWTVSSDLPAPHTGKAAFAVNPADGDDGCTDATKDSAGSRSMTSPEIVRSTTGMRMRFQHFVQTEGGGYDGANLKFSLDGGAFNLVPASAIVWNPYNTTLAAAADGNTNPLAGQAAWGGADQGGALGSWGVTIIDLDKLGGAPGAKIRFRFDLGQDSCNGSLGWVVDEVKVVSCPAPPTLSLGGDYVNPDTDGNYTLNWVRPAGAVGPDLVQESTSCGASFSDDGEEALVFGANSLWEGSEQWQSSANTAGGDGSTAYFISDTSSQDEALTLIAPIAIPAGASASLKFDTTYNLEAEYDYGYIEASGDNGATWKELGSLNGPADAVLPTDVTDTTLTYDLSEFAGKSVLVRFRMTSDLFNTTAPLGWYVDNISISISSWTDVASPTTATTLITNRPTGNYCYRVKTRFPGTDALVDSPFSNSVNTVVTRAPNAAPTANAGMDDTANEGEAVLLSGAASSDPDAGDVLSYAWTQKSGPTVMLTGADTATPSFLAPDVSLSTDFVFELKVTDTGGLTSTDTVKVTVNDLGGSVTPTPATPVIGNNAVGGLPLASVMLLGLAGLARRRRA